MSLVIGICGASGSGKTSVANLVKDCFSSCKLIAQDDFYLSDADITAILQGKINWDCIEAINIVDLLSHIADACQEYTLVIVEGHMLTLITSLVFDTIFYLEIDESTCKQRRERRIQNGDPDPLYYFEEYVWPCAQKAREAALLCSPILTKSNDSITAIVDRVVLHIIEKHKAILKSASTKQ